LEYFRPRPKPADAPPRVGIIANLTPVKGHELFLEMARILVDRGLEPEFWLVGRDKDSGDQVRAQVESLCLRKHVQFLGYQSDIPRVLANLDVVVSSSHMECCPVNVIEAMACGRPVVVTRVGGSPELVEDGQTGVVVPPRDPSAMADAVGYLLQNESLREAMGKAGRARAERLFCREVYARSVMNLYESVLRRN
jgi:glycosyltransferase involved in cell wall biosynthesis